MHDASHQALTCFSQLNDQVQESTTTTTQVTTPQTNASTNVVENTTPNNSTINNNTTHTTSAAHKFFIIAGSYPSQKGAEDAISLLKTTGFPNAEMVGLSSNGSWRIAYSGFATKDDAKTELAKIKQTITSAWIYEKK